MTLILIGWLMGSMNLYAGTAGKIAGSVRNAETGEALAGATVSIVGRNAATSTDLDGEFYLINLPVATYDVVVQLIGYQTELRK